MAEEYKCYCGNHVPKGKKCSNCGRIEYQSIRDSKRYRSS